MSQGPENLAFASRGIVLSSSASPVTVGCAVQEEIGHIYQSSHSYSIDDSLVTFTIIMLRCERNLEFISMGLPINS